MKIRKQNQISRFYTLHKNFLDALPKSFSRSMQPWQKSVVINLTYTEAKIKGKNTSGISINLNIRGKKSQMKLSNHESQVTNSVSHPEKLQVLATGRLTYAVKFFSNHNMNISAYVKLGLVT